MSDFVDIINVAILMQIVFVKVPTKKKIWC